MYFLVVVSFMAMMWLLSLCVKCIGKATGEGAGGNDFSLLVMLEFTTVFGSV